MSDTLKKEDLLIRIDELTRQLEHKNRIEQINRTLYNISKMVSTTHDLSELYVSIHQSLSRVVDTTNFYIALYDSNDDSLDFVYFVDQVDSKYPKAFNVSSSASLTAEVIRLKKPKVFLRDDILALRQQAGKFVPACSLSEIWLGVPLQSRREIIGVMAVQSYHQPDLYGEEDLEVLVSVADQVATAIERKRYEDALVENEERFRLSMEANQDGLWDWDIPTDLVYYSPGYWRMLGFESKEDFLGSSAWRDLIHPDDQEHTKKINQECIENKRQSFSVEFRMKTRSEGWKWILGKGKAAKRNSTGEAVRMVGTHTDITERKLAEEALANRVVALTRPLNDDVSIDFTGLFDIKDMQRLQDEFANAMGVASIITDVNGTPITRPSNFTRLCGEIIRGTDVGIKNCYQSDSKLGKFSDKGPIVQPCLSGGLWDAGAGIAVGGHHIANWLIGQVRDETQSDEKMVSFAHEIGVDPDDFLEAFHEVPTMSKERFDAIATVLYTFTQQLSVTAYQNVQQARFITKLKMLEEDARRSAERIRVVFSSINDAILVHPLKKEGFGPFVEVNDVACKRYGYSREEFCRLTTVDITLSEDVIQHGTAKQRSSLAEAGQVVFETTHIKKNGDTFPVEISANVVEMYGQNMILAVVRDISERKIAQQERARLEGQLNQAQKMESVGRLAGGVAHDFNNMLSVILGYTEMSLDQVSSTSSLFRDLKEIQTAAEHSADLTKQLLAFARKQSVMPKIININETIEKLLNMMGRILGEDICLDWNPGEDMWLVKIDPGQMDQILTNLCVNSRDAINGIGRISIETSNVQITEAECQKYIGLLPGLYIRLKVSDDGKGIDENIIPYIFEPFYTTKKVGEGTGLGLATVYGILKQNDGFIHVESDVSEGCEFIIHLPKNHIEVSAEEGGNGVMERTVEVGHIVMVEDDHTMLRMGKKMLESCGYKVSCASSPLKAIKLLEENSIIDLLITDVVMPEMNGRELADHAGLIKPGIKILFMSGYTADIIGHQGILNDGVDFIQKPFSRNDFLQKVKDIIDGV